MNKKTNNNIRQRKLSESVGVDTGDHDQTKKKDKKKISHFGTITSGTEPITHRIWTRTVMVFCFLILVYFFTHKDREIKFATYREHIPIRFQKISCSQNYLDDIQEFPKCVPILCGRFITDSLIEQKEIDILLDIAKSGINLGGSSGGASILDLHSGALSKGEHFVNIYSLPEAKKVFRKEHLLTYKMVKTKIKHAISEKFHIDENALYLTHPTFFSRITNVTAKTIHDEYWHPHIDKETYESFHYTSLLYLTDFGKDFTGGRFIFIDGNEKNKTIITIEPKRGRVSAFTSGAENVHSVENVTAGIRYAITISFTCNPKFAINDPDLNLKD